jgi:hypothetical protein
MDDRLGYSGTWFGMSFGQRAADRLPVLLDRSQSSTCLKKDDGVLVIERGRIVSMGVV